MEWISFCIELRHSLAHGRYVPSYVYKCVSRFSSRVEES